MTQTVLVETEFNKTYRGAMPKKDDIVQVRNPRSGRYVKINRTEGQIVSHKKSEGPYKNVPVARKSAKG